MTLTQRIKKGLSNISTKAKIGALTVAAGAASLFLADKAQAKDYDEWLKSKEKTSIAAQLDESSTWSDINKFVDGYVGLGTSGNWASQQETAGLYANASALLKPTDWLRITIDGTANWLQAKDLEYHGPNTEIDTEAGLAGAAAYFLKEKEAELYARIHAGCERNGLNKSLNGEANRFLVGGQAGLALKDFRASTVLLYGKGDCEYELQSGFKDKGLFETYYIGGDISALLRGRGKKQNYASQGSFDQYFAGEDLTTAIYAVAQANWSKNRLARLQNSESFEVRGSMPCIFNMYDYAMDKKGNISAEGFLWSIEPHVDYMYGASGSDLVAATTETHSILQGLTLKCEYKRMIGLKLDGGIGYRWEDTKDPVNGDHRSQGPTSNLSVELFLRF